MRKWKRMTSRCEPSRRWTGVSTRRFMLPSMVASSWRMSSRREEGKRGANDEGVEGIASSG